jgi:hypothetical protein
MKSNRKFQILLACLISLLLCHFVWSQTVPKEGLASITPQEMKEHVYFLASDGMKGRNTPSPELDSCAAYIAGEFQSYGLEGLGPENSYYQTFNVLRSRLSEPNTFDLKTSEGITEYKLKNDFVPLHVTANRKIKDVPIVFAGYGITAPEYNYDDYASIDVKNKVVLIFSNEPQARDTSSVFEGRKQTEHGKLRVKLENAMDRGAVGLLLVGNPTRRFRRPPNAWPSLMRKPLPNAVPLTMEESMDKKIVAVQIGKQLVDDLMLGTEKNLANIFTEIDASLTPQSFELKDKTITLETALSGEKHPTHNVVGFWEGSDPDLKKEYIVIGGHYDHVGVNNDSIYNGADDNASGTAGVMEIAEAFAQSGIRPKRSVLFMAFAGEEKGLFGSNYYADNPIIPRENLIAMLNMDMISRNDTSEVVILGSRTSSDLKSINEKVNESIGMTLKYQDRYFMQSDHYPFYRKDIPVLFYHTGDTPDLHKTTDDPEKIIPEKMATIGQLVFSTAWMVVDGDKRPDFTKIR